MKNSFIIYNIRRALLKQLILPVLLFLVSIFILILTPRDNIFNPRPLNYKSNYESFYNRKLPHVTVTVSGLKYSGLDYIVDGHIRGHYFYTLLDGHCQLYILSRESDITEQAELPPRTLRGRLVMLDEVEYKTTLKKMAEALNWSPSSLQMIVSRYAVTNVSYPFYADLLFRFVLWGCFLLSLSDILCGITHFFMPLSSPAFCGLRNRRKASALLSQVELEMKHSGFSISDSIYLMPDYIMNTKTVTGMILPLRSIVWAHFGRKRRTLFLVTEGGRTFSYPCTVKEPERILDLIKEQAPHIMIGYSRQNRRMVKKGKRLPR